LNDFLRLLRNNRNYRWTWSGQVVSEVGDHFNNIAVFSLALANTGSGLVVAGILIARAIPAVMAGPVAGVLLANVVGAKPRWSVVTAGLSAVQTALGMLSTAKLDAVGSIVLVGPPLSASVAKLSTIGNR
jgi:hypothetical protein